MGLCHGNRGFARGCRRACIAGSMLALAAMAGGCGDKEAPPSPSPLKKSAPSLPSHKAKVQPDIILISVDTLRSDHVGSYGYGRDTTPNVDRLADNGILFERAVSQAPWTLPAMASIHTSLYPSQHGATGTNKSIAPEVSTLAEALKEEGYATAGFISHLLLTPQYGFAQGFDVFDGSNAKPHDAITSENLTRLALEQVNVPREEPLFLWVHYFDPHVAFMAQPEHDFTQGYEGELSGQLVSSALLEERIPVLEKMGPADRATEIGYVTDLYDGEIAYTDHWIGVLIDGVNKNSSRPKMILFVADHGEYFMERGRFDHSRDVYDELVHVPLIISGTIDDRLRGTTVLDAVETASLAKTIMVIAGQESIFFQGVDLLGVARGTVTAPTVVFSEGSYPGFTEPKVSAESDGWKLIHNAEEDDYELYNLEEDPEELYNLYGTDQGLNMTSRLMPEVSEYARRLSGEAPIVELTTSERKQLENLGYVERDVEQELVLAQRPVGEGKLTREEVMQRIRARMNSMRSEQLQDARKLKQENQ